MLSGKKILLGVTGSISAYKSVFLTRLLVQNGAEVRVIMTPAATEFVSPLTFGTLSKHPVSIDLVKNHDTGEWENHVELGNWADLFIIAPATANTIGKMVYGIADNLLLTTWLSAKCKVMVAPAMDHDMFHHFSTQKNLATLKENGTLLLEPGQGELASGLIGDGRLAEPEEMLKAISSFFLSEHFSGKFSNKNVVITAGPTFEELDPVRYIGNYSTGKMGFALAEAFVNAGANVHLVHGPVSIAAPKGLKSITAVKSGEEMLNAVLALYPTADIAVMSAAVADYKPKERSSTKIKKADTHLSLELEKTTDILLTLGQKKSKQVLVGFALETNNELENAADKLKRKNLDLIVLNSMNDAGAGFAHDTNKITVLDANNKIHSFELMSKQKAAEKILHVISTLL